MCCLLPQNITEMYLTAVILLAYCGVSVIASPFKYLFSLSVFSLFVMCFCAAVCLQFGECVSSVSLWFLKSNL